MKFRSYSKITFYMNECYVRLQCPLDCAAANFDFFSRHKGHLTCFISYYCNFKFLFIIGSSSRMMARTQKKWPSPFKLSGETDCHNFELLGSCWAARFTVGRVFHLNCLSDRSPIINLLHEILHSVWWGLPKLDAAFIVYWQPVTQRPAVSRSTESTWNNLNDR